MNKLFKHIAAFILILFVQVTFAQSEEKILLNEGIESYDKGEYTIALEKFEKAIDLNSDYTAAYYNAANASYRLGDFEKAKNYYDSYTNLLDNDINKAKALHNLGNVFLKEYEKSPQSEQGIKNLKNSISTYKKALRYNPEDKETRYNLSYALSKLPKENEQNKKDKQDNQDKQDKNDEDKKEDKEQQNQDRKDQQDKRDQENKEKQDQQNKENQENQQDKNNQENQSDSKKSEEQKEKEAQKLPEEVEKYLTYNKEAGRGLDDFVKLQKDFSKIPDADLLKSYYQSTKPGLDSSDIEYLIERDFGTNEEESY